MKNQRGGAETLILGLLFVLAMLAICVLAYWFEAAQCGKKAKMMGLEHDYGPFTGCMVKVGNRYAPINYIRIVDEKVIIQGDGE